MRTGKAIGLWLRYVLLTWVYIWGLLQANAQVGIGTTSPTAELDIKTASTGIPALMLAPQSGPVGSATGQMAVIEDKLFLYDATRGKWLSVESTALQFGYSLGADNQVLWLGGDVGYDPSTETLTGAKMPFDGTIVYLTVEASGGKSNKGFEIWINGTATSSFNLSSWTYNNTGYNIDFNAGDYIMVKAVAAGSAVNDPAAIVWVKWRI